MSKQATEMNSMQAMVILALEGHSIAEDKARQTALPVIVRITAELIDMGALSIAAGRPTPTRPALLAALNAWRDR